MSSHSDPNDVQTQFLQEEQQRIQRLYSFLVNFEPGSSTLPVSPYLVTDREILFASTAIAGIRHSMVRNMQRLENVLRQNATLLVKRDVDILLFSKPVTEERIPRSPTPPHPRSLRKTPDSHPF